MDAAVTGGEMLSPGEAEWPPELRLPPPPPPPKRRSTENRVPPPPPAPHPATPLRSTEQPPPPPSSSGHRMTAWLQASPAASHPKQEPSPPEGFDDSHFLGSIMGPAAGAPLQQPVVAEPPVVVKRKRGRPRKIRDGDPSPAAAAAAPAPPPKPAKKNEEEVCFICFDGGSLVVCDRRGCSKVYHPACIKRDESFFRLRGKWNCGWHICSSCEKASQYMCYTCTHSLCSGCTKQGKFFGVRGKKGFCDTCYNTIVLIESKDEDFTKVVKVDFDDKNSWEYLFKLYWLDLKGKHLLTLEELISAKSNWTVRSTSARREKEESSGERYDANSDHGASSDSSSRKQRWGASLRKRGRKRQTHGAVTAEKCEISVKGSESLTKLVPFQGMDLSDDTASLRKRGRKRQNHGVVTAEKCEMSVKGSESLTKLVPFQGMDLSDDTKWASPELLEFVGHMRNGDKSHISQYDVQILLLEYIKQNNLRDSERKSQIICDEMLSSLFRKPRVGHFEMLKLLDMHFLLKETPTVNGDSQRPHDPDSAQVDSAGYSEMATKLVSEKRRKTNKKLERDPPSNLEDYAAIDVHNINLIYLRRSLMEDIIGDVAAFSEIITGAFVRIRISGAGQNQDMYRLVKVLGTHKVAERYSVGKKMTDFALAISNLDKKEVITMDTISNQDFTEEECKRLRQSMKYDLIPRLKVGDICEKAKVFQSLQINDWLENEKQRLSHLRDRASETGRRKELRECVEKLQLLNTPEERERRINEVPEVHVDPHMAPDYESAEEWNDKTAVDWPVNRNGSDLPFPGSKVTESNSLQFLPQKCPDSSRHTSVNPPTEGVTHRPEAGSNINLQSTNGWNIPRPPIDLNNTAGEAASVSSSGVVSSDPEQEKVWNYRDPSGNVQGPFALSQLSKWTNYFPRGMKIWLTFESEENSLLLTEVLSQRQQDFIQPTPVINYNKSTWAGPGKDRTNSSMAENITSPIGFNSVYSSGLPSQSADCSRGRDNPNFLGEALPSTTGWEPVKNSQTSLSQAQHQANYSCTSPSSAVSYGPPGSHKDGVPGEKIGENNNRQETAGLWSPIAQQNAQSNQSTMKPDPGVCATQKQQQDDSKSNSLAGCVKNLNTKMVSCSQKIPIPAPELERKLPFMNKSASTSVAPEDSAAKAYDHSSMPFVSKISSAEEERPQCSSPIALSPWGEPGYYQGETVDSALWGVQDDPSNDMWSLSSPAPALQPSADVAAGGKDTSCIIEEVIVAQGNIVVEISPTPDGEKIEKGNSSVPTGCGMPEQVKLKPSAASSSSFKSTEASGRQPLGSSLEGSTKASDRQPSRSSLEGSAKVLGRQPAGSFLDGSTKVSGRQPSGSFLEGNTKASGWQLSGSSLDASVKGSGWGSSLEGSTKASGWGSSTEGSTKASGWGSSTEGSTKASGWGVSTDGSTKASGWGASLEGSTKASGWLGSSSSPDGRKTAGCLSSAHESSKANSRSASQNLNSSSSHQTTAPTVKSSSEAPRRQGNTNSNSSGRGGAPGNNKSWHPSSGNANRGSQSSQHYDRYSQANDSRRSGYQGSESRRGSSNHFRRPDHRQDHGSRVSSRSSSSRGQPERGVCKYYESGYCKNGPSCKYIHR